MSSTAINETALLNIPDDDTYSVDTGPFDQRQWHDIVVHFDDANLMQAWSYGAIRWGQENLSHLVLRKNGEIVAAAQVVTKKVPVLGSGLSHIKRGPMWQPRGKERDPEVLRQMIRALREIYSVQRGMLLRIFPACVHDLESIRSIFEEEGFDRNLSIGVPKTVFLDLSYSLEELRGSLKSTWRRNLVLAERHNLVIKHGTSDELFGAFTQLYVELLDRKKIGGVVDITHYQEMQKVLPESLKMRVMLCECNGENVAGIVVPYVGTIAQNMLAATGDKGLALRGSYLLQWKMLEWLKDNGCRWYDLDAVNHELYPGISQFKMGFAGKLGWEVEYPGQFESCTSTVSQSSVRVGEWLLKTYGDTHSALKHLKSRRANHASNGY
jgi:lipid II:glycine glycyltransferase (peptidoglycan interpeptide bridge formation enzyme)